MIYKPNIRLLRFNDIYCIKFQYYYIRPIVNNVKTDAFLPIDRLGLSQNNNIKRNKIYGIYKMVRN